MSSYDFVVNNMRFSYSSATTFDTCRYAFKLTYIEVLEPKANNFFAEYGTLIHECFEKFFTGELDSFDLSRYYEERYKKVVVTPPPSYPVGMEEKYMEQARVFFENFFFSREEYDVLLVEGKLDFTIGDVVMTARPDLVLKNKKTGIISLHDYKTATPFWTDRRTGKEVRDAKKIDSYYRQMAIYTYALRVAKGIAVDEITLWFPRLNKTLTIPKEEEKETAAIAYVLDTIERIRKEEEFPFNTGSPYFCDNLCSVRNFCEFRA